MYYVAQNNEKTGPYTLDQLRGIWNAGTVGPQTLFWQQGMEGWQPLEIISASLLTAPLMPGAFPPAAAGPLSPVSTSHEPSAYDLPAARLPAGPVTAAPVSARTSLLPTAAVSPASTPMDASSALIAPTRLPAGAGGLAPVGSAYPANAGSSFPPEGLSGGPPQMPPAAYLSLGFALFGPVLVVMIPVAGWLIGGGMMIAAVVCGHSARAGIQQSGNRLPGKGIATAGLVLGYAGMVFAVLFILGIILLFGYAIIHGTHPDHVPR